MPSDPPVLPNIILRLKAWRKAEGLSQSKTALALAEAGLPVALRTLQQWEIGQHAPHAVTAAAIEKFLAERERTFGSKRDKTVAPVIQRLKAWREANHLSQAQAVEVLFAYGLPANVKTLQGWEIGRHSPQPITAAALARFLEQHPTVPLPSAKRSAPSQSAVKSSGTPLFSVDSFVRRVERS